MADIKEKIQKLLSLATSNNENEAKSALLKAKELMAKHKLEEADFEEISKQEIKTQACPEVKWTTDSGEIWISAVTTIIADNHCCVAAWSTKKGSRTHELVLTGMEDDLAVCKAVIEFAIGAARHAVKIQCRKCREASGKDVAASYGQGFALGLKDMYDAQAAEHAEWGLVVVKPEEVQEYEKNLGQRSVRTKKTKEVGAAYMEGYEDGRRFNAQNKLAKEA